MKELKQSHGGEHEGAGRKAAYNELTKVARVPESRILEIKAYLKKTKIKSRSIKFVRLILSLT